ncbi:hypothetical protein RvY_14906 [Ramazzottius varieornatus]|uniref:Uncharacterized protein n=1 Tax=Ramazzottius varieornatus TaxID=947166 RepID=A0A1D1W190_RAMVA|nr:hypothetical protein RvY_14906 [Ramazzottius varieornatus]
MEASSTSGSDNGQARSVMLPQPTESHLVSRSIILFIQESGMMLEAKELTVAMATLLFHTYANAHDVVGIDLEESTEPSNASAAKEETKTRGLPNDQMVAAACLLLAGKMEENHFNIRKLINVAYKTHHKEELRDINEYYSLRGDLLALELWLLRIIGFRSNFAHPHKYLVCYLKAVKDWLPPDTFARHPLVTLSWCLMRDAYLSEMVVREKPEHIAVAVLVCSLRLCKVVVPEESRSDRHWTKGLCADLASAQLDNIVNALMDIYS